MTDNTQYTPELPEASVWTVRSTYATLLTLLLVALRLLGYDPDGWMAANNLVSEVLVEAIWQVIPFVSAAWAWWERKAPKYKLVFWRSKAQ